MYTVWFLPIAAPRPYSLLSTATRLHVASLSNMDCSDGVIAGGDRRRHALKGRLASITCSFKLLDKCPDPA